MCTSTTKVWGGRWGGCRSGSCDVCKDGTSLCDSTVATFVKSARSNFKLTFTSTGPGEADGVFRLDTLFLNRVDLRCTTGARERTRDGRGKETEDLGDTAKCRGAYREIGIESEE